MKSSSDSASCSPEDSVQSSCSSVAIYQAPFLSEFHQNEKEFEFLNQKIKIQQNWNEHGVAAVVWDAATVLAEYLIEHAQMVRDRRVLELGAGTGLVSIVAGLLGGHVVSSDLTSVVPQLRKNIEQNCHRHDDTACDVTVTPLHWGDAMNDDVILRQPFDIILGADIIYIPETYSPLLHTLNELTSARPKGPSNEDHSTIVVILAVRHRYDREESFLALLRENSYSIDVIYHDKMKDIFIYQCERK